MDNQLRLRKLKAVLSPKMSQCSFKTQLSWLQGIKPRTEYDPELLPTLERMVESSRKQVTAKKNVLTKYQKLEQQYLLYFYSMQWHSKELREKENGKLAEALMNQGISELNEVFLQMDTSSDTQIQIKFFQNFQQRLNKTQLKKQSKALAIKKAEIYKKGIKAYLAENRQAVVHPPEEMKKRTSFQKLQKKPLPEEEKEPSKKIEREREISERGVLISLIDKRVKDFASLSGSTVETGFARQLYEHFNKFMMSLLEQLVKYSSIENEGHQFIGNEFMLFEKKQFPPGLKRLKPFSESFSNAYSAPLPSKRRIVKVYKVPIHNPLQEYTLLLEMEAEQEAALLNKLNDEIADKYRNKKEIEKEVLESLFIESKNLSPANIREYERAHSLREHGRKPLNKRLTIRITAIQVWLEENNIPHLLEKSYFK